MPFFAPVPWEADRFYTQSACAVQDISLRRFPVGTGPYTLDLVETNWKIVMDRNENYVDRERYPTEGEPGDEAKGLLKDAGKLLPFIDSIIFVMEKESIPRWNKFLQGYYDTSGVGNDVFDQAVKVSESGSQLTDSLLDLGIRLETSTSPWTSYYAFNMLDDVVGGYTEAKRKLRQAVSIALDLEEYIQIFYNERAIVAHGPVPPGIKGHLDGPEDYNKVVFDWDAEENRAVRKSVDEAKRLLAEAGYPNGIGPEGRPLVLYFDTTTGAAGNKAETDWLRKQFGKIGIQLQVRATDYSQFQDKVREGNYQILRWGWIADYPDAENFLFLLYGPNGKVRAQGENAANYSNPRFDELFRKMETMSDTPERMAIIREMMAIARQDAPWIWGMFPISYGLYHSWIQNMKPSAMTGGAEKYHRIDWQSREALREERNDPVTWPIWVLLSLLAAGVAPAARRLLHRMREEAGE
jgi:ABC-type transport system substrate-binding protein